MSYEERLGVARPLARYLNQVRQLVNNDEKFFSCLTSIIIDFSYSVPPNKMAEMVIEHG